MSFNGHTIIDGDGHVIEDTKAIVEFMPPAYREKYDTHSFFNPFPPLDHLHSSNLHDFQPGAFNKVGPDGWVQFLEDVGIEIHRPLHHSRTCFWQNRQSRLGDRCRSGVQRLAPQYLYEAQPAI